MATARDLLTLSIDEIGDATAASRSFHVFRVTKLLPDLYRDLADVLDRMGEPDQAESARAEAKRLSRRGPPDPARLFGDSR